MWEKIKFLRDEIAADGELLKAVSLISMGAVLGGVAVLLTVGL